MLVDGQLMSGATVMKIYHRGGNATMFVAGGKALSMVSEFGAAHAIPHGPLAMMHGRLISNMAPTLTRTVTLALFVLAVAGCSGQTEYAYPETSKANQTSGDFYAQEETLFGDGLRIGGEDTPEQGSAGGTGIAVNSFLWRASLDTVSFLPLVSADPFGGVIITDWYQAPETPTERVKVQVYILDRQLRSDGIRVSVFRERQTESGWVAEAVSKRTVETIEDSILSRARELRVQSEV